MLVGKEGEFLSLHKPSWKPWENSTIFKRGRERGKLRTVLQVFLKFPVLFKEMQTGSCRWCIIGEGSARTATGKAIQEDLYKQKALVL